ncbi:hypothetical protein OEZ85_003572 [Tetradesmus obliquus]|uniref:Uncharacterized protein n=1 Tax=Tetradesmus obliquus TaxID=3088 RepID=A0ABY8UC68_TETOB|nr:hypothetical protein OEZ85_003572 [Tetradesmus obliquus]
MLGANELLMPMSTNRTAPHSRYAASPLPTVLLVEPSAVHDLMPQQQRRASGRHAASHQQQQQQYSCKQHARALAAAGDLMAQEVAAGVDRDTPPAAVLTSNCAVSMSAQDACTTPTCTALIAERERRAC